ncbi:MAG TPA: hypothetical protein VK173_09920, partial [Lacibacter sp.]|nr:hypothetical protein [Lacibacter sp.]
MNRLLLSVVILLSINSNAQTIKLETNKLEPVQVFMSIEKLMGSEVVKVIKDSSVKAVDEPTFVKIKDVDFSNGIIEVKVLSKLLKNASEF